MISTRILKHSVNSAGDEIITWELTYPRFIHSEVMTHRMFSRNSASSRAIPVKEMLRAVWRAPAVPIHWGKNGKGMQAKIELSGWRRALVKRLWLLARIPVIVFVWLLVKIGLHKQISNRLLEPWMHMTIVMTATEHDNWFSLRDHEDAQPEIRELARKMRTLLKNSQASPLKDGEWHIPFLTHAEECAVDQGKCVVEDALKVATARAARASYTKHTVLKSFEDDVALHDRLVESRHWSPFEHCAMADSSAGWVGNFRGFRQYRKMFKGESGRKSYNGLT